MNIKVETEMKYYCMEPEKLISIANKLKEFKEVSNNYESDEYFTDVNSEFIKNRTCLRIRKKNNEDMEITFKGKSSSLLGSYCKIENNIKMDQKEYDSFTSFLASLGFYSYVIVKKERLTLSKKVKDLFYSIMIDKLPNIGGYVEFEIISNSNDYTKEELKNKLTEFIKEFSEIKLTEVNEPYRDIVAKSIYKKISNKSSKDIYIDIDNILIPYEKDFYNKNKNKFKELTKTNIIWGYYKKNQTPEFRKLILPLIKEYLDGFISDDKELLIMLELLNKVNYKPHLITKTNRDFSEELFKKLNYNIDIINSETGGIRQTFIKNNIKSTDVIYIKEDTIRNINSDLLVVINNE